MTVHDLKVWTAYFWDIKAGRKTFEVRVNDRGFEVGDELVLHEWEAIPQKYTGQTVRVVVTYICDIRNIMNEDIVGMSIEVIDLLESQVSDPDHDPRILTKREERAAFEDDQTRADYNDPPFAHEVM